MKPEELITQELGFLTSALGTLTPDSKMYNNVQAAITSVTSVQNATSLAEASMNLAGDEDFYRKAIKSMGILDKTDLSYNINLETLRRLNVLLSFEVDKTNAEGLDTARSRTVKQQAIESYYLKNGFYTKPAKGEAVKAPTVEDMAKFEKRVERTYRY